MPNKNYSSGRPARNGANSDGRRTGRPAANAGKKEAYGKFKNDAYSKTRTPSERVPRDKDELAPPRFLERKRSEGAGDKTRAYQEKRPYSKSGGPGVNKDRYASGDQDRKRSGDSTKRDDRPYEKRERTGDRRPYGTDRPYAGKERAGDRKPYGADKPYAGKERTGDRKPYGSDRPYAGKERTGERKPYGSDRSFAGKERTGERKPYNNDRPYSGKEKYEGNPIAKDSATGDKKPFRPKYDPQVKVKKTFSERKKELLGEPVQTDDIRLNKYIANSGICSRREADELIKQGLVSVNGEVITEMGHRVKKEDTVKFDGRKILPEPFVYIIMNKPKDFITTTEDDKGRKTVMDLLADKIDQRVYPIGRLDRNTTGVLLLTNDGEVSQALTHPAFEIKKVYHVVLDKKVSASDLDKMVEGIDLEDGRIFADAVSYVETEDKRHVGVEIHSGKNRVVRRMFEHLGYDVEKLDRVSVGIFTKKDLPRGKWRFLSQSEVGFLMKLKGKSK